MANPVSVSDVQARFPRTFTDAEETMAQAYLDDVWEEALARVTDLEARLDAGTLRPGLVIRVIVPLVKSVMLNPGGFSEESIDDWRGRRSEASATGSLLLSDADFDLLQPGADSAGAFEIVLSG